MIPYMERTRAYYQAQGYPAYAWAQNDSVPFTPMSGALREARLVLISTAAPFRPELGDQGPGARYNADAKFYDVFTAPIEPAPDLRISHIGYDRKHCRADDARTWLPIPALQGAAGAGLIGELAEELISVPTNRSQRVTREKDAVDAMRHVERLKADVVLLVPT